MYPVYEAINHNISVVYREARHIPPHLHHAVELVYITKGSLEFGLGQELWHMEEGDFAIAFPNMIHHYQVFSKDINEACFILAAPSICGSFAEKLQKYYPESPVIPREQVSEEIIYAIQFLAKTQQEDFIAEQAYLQILLAKSLPYLELAERGTMEGSGFVYQSVCYIAEHFKEDFSLSQMASDLGVSKYVLSRLFSNTFHTNFIKYINEMRLDYACTLLEDTNRTITDICMEAGFESQRTFNRVFRKQFHMTPREFRNHWKDRFHIKKN